MDQTIVLQAENGTEFTNQQRISLLVPSSIKAYTPTEAYLQVDFSMTDPVATFDGEAIGDGTNAMFQLNPFIGIHSVFRDIILYDGNGRELDSTRNSDVCAMAHFPWSCGSDELALKSSQEGIGTWASRPNQLPSNFDPENAMKASYAANLYYNNPNFDGTTSENTSENTTVPLVRSQRFTFPLNELGFFNSSAVFPNVLCNGQRLDLLLQSLQKSCFPIYGGGIQGAVTLNGTNFAVDTTGTLPEVHNSSNDLFRRGLCVGTVITLNEIGGAGVYSGRITSIALENNGGTTITIGQITDDVPSPPADGNYEIVYVGSESHPLRFPSWKINNVQFYVRETLMTQSQIDGLRGGANYTWVSHYNVPQSLAPNSFNPTISWNVLPLNQVLGIVCMPYDETYNGSNSLDMVEYPYGLTKWLFDLENMALVPPGYAYQNKIQSYQFQIGTELQPTQPDETIQQIVPQYMNYEVKNYFNALGRSVYNFKIHSLDSDKNLFNPPTAPANNLIEGQRWLPHRQFTLALAPSPSQVLSLVDKPVQLRINTNTSLEHQYTFQLYIAHYRTAILGGDMGTQIMM
jgi:hypothetical protein